VHEITLCRTIAGMVTEAAAGRPVRRVGLRVGALRQVAPETLVSCWDLVSGHTALAGSVLDIEPVPVQIGCAACGQTSTPAALLLRCAGCDSTDVTVVAGEELLLTTLD
jgi:hydrogenase nickel incorporation protein HypA/HybF